MNIEDLQARLAQQIEILASGEGDPARVNAMVNAAGKVISSIRLQLEFARMIGVKPTVPMLQPAALSADK